MQGERLGSKAPDGIGMLRPIRLAFAPHIKPTEKSSINTNDDFEVLGHSTPH
jgi:hypothetical protein